MKARKTIMRKRKKNKDSMYRKNSTSTTKAMNCNVSFLNKIKIKVVDSIIEKAIAHYNKKINDQGTATLFCPKDFLVRITCNFIRHKHTNYDELIRRTYPDSFNRASIKRKVNEMIFNKYKLEEIV